MVFVVLLLLSFLTPQTPAADTVAGVIGGRIKDDHLGHEVSAFTLPGVGFFLIFLAGVWSRLRRSEGGGGMFAGLFVMAGAIFAAILLVSEGFHLALVKAATADDAGALPALVWLADWAGLSALPAAVAMLLGAAASIGTSQAFPTWLGLLSGVREPSTPRASWAF